MDAAESKIHRLLPMRVTSIVVLITFLVTQFDIQLAFSYAPPSPIVNPITTPPKDDLKDIHFAQDFDELEGDQPGPLTPTATPEEVTLSEEEIAELPESFFTINPLLHAEGELEVTEIEGRLRFKYSNGSSYEVGKEDGKIYVVKDFTGAEDENGDPTLETRTYSYFTENEQNYARIDIAGERFEIYEMDADGMIAGIVRSGILRDGADIVTRVYDRESRTITVTDPDQPAFQAVYEMDDYENIWRLLSSHSLENGETIELEIRYDDQAQTRTLINRTSGFFEVHRLVDGTEAGDLLRIGTLEVSGSAETLRVTHEITISILERDGQILPVYISKDTALPDLNIIRERLPSGALGRLLAVNGLDENHQMVHQEFFYSTDTNGVDIVTVVDYVAKSYLKLEIEPETVPDGFWIPSGRVVEAGEADLLATPPTGTASLRRSDAFVDLLTLSQERYYWAEDQFLRPHEANWIQLRGPPMDDSAVSFEIFQYERSAYFFRLASILQIDFPAYIEVSAENPDVVLEEGAIGASPDDGGVLYQFTVALPGAEEPASLPQESGTEPTGAPGVGLGADPASLIGDEAGAWNLSQLLTRQIMGDREGEVTFISIAAMSEEGKTGWYQITVTADGKTYVYEYDPSQEKIYYHALDTANQDRLYRFDAEARLEAVLDPETQEVLKEYRYDLEKGRVLEFNYENHVNAFQIYQLESDGRTSGRLLMLGFFDLDKKTYSQQEIGKSGVAYYTFGDDGLMLNEDDQVTTGGTSSSSATGSGGSGADLSVSGGGSAGGDQDSKIEDLKRLIRRFVRCVQDPGRKDFTACQRLFDDIESLRADLESSGVSGGGLGLSLNLGGESGGSQDLNRGTTNVPPVLLPNLSGIGIAPIANPDAVIQQLDQHSAWIDLNGTRQLWHAGGDGVLGSGDDILEEYQQDAGSGKVLKYLFDATTGRLKQAVLVDPNAGTTTVVAQYSYDDATGIFTVEQENGNIFRFHYESGQDPLTKRELLSYSYMKNGVLITCNYADGQIQSVLHDGLLFATYAYDARQNTVLISQADGTTRTYNLGGDRSFGTDDDFLISASGVELAALLASGDYTTELNDAEKQARLVFEGGRELIVGYGEDGQWGTADDQLLSSSGFGVVTQRDASSRLLAVADDASGLLTRFSYSGNETGISTLDFDGNVMLTAVLKLLADGRHVLKSLEGNREGRTFKEIFDNEGNILIRNGWESVLRRNADGMLLNEEGMVVFTEEEAAREWRHVLQTYRLNEDDNSLTVITQRFDAQGNLILEPIRQVTTQLGDDGLWNTTDDRVIHMRVDDGEDRYEEAFDILGRVVLHQNLATGDALQYEYDDNAGTVTVTSSNGEFKQIYAFTEGHAGDWSYATLIYEENAGVRRSWDEGGGLTWVTDAEGRTSYYRNGVLAAVTDAQGNILQQFQHFQNQLTGEITGVGFEGQALTSSVVVDEGVNASGNRQYKIVYSNGVILHYEWDQLRQKFNVLTYDGGNEFVNKVESNGAFLEIFFHDGRVITYSQIAGLYQIKSVRDIYGTEEVYYYFEEMPACEEAPGTSGCSDKADLDYSIRANGTKVVYQKDPMGDTIENNTGEALVEYVLASNGHRTYYEYDGPDENGRYEIRKTWEVRDDGRYVQITLYADDPDTADRDIKAMTSYQFSFDGTRILSRQVYDYDNTNATMVSTISQYNLQDIPVASYLTLDDPETPTDEFAYNLTPIATAGWLEAVTHFMPKTYTDGTSGDIYEIGLVDRIFNYAQGGDLLTATFYTYNVIYMTHTTTYVPAQEGAVCTDRHSLAQCRKTEMTIYEEGAFGERRAQSTTHYSRDWSSADPAAVLVTSYDEFKYRADPVKGDPNKNSETNEYDYTIRYADETKTTTISAFRQIEIESRYPGAVGAYLIHDFGDDFIPSGDDQFTVQIMKKDTNDLDGDGDQGELGTEIFVFRTYDGTVSPDGDYGISWDPSNRIWSHLGGLETHSFQVTGNEEENSAYIQNWRVVDGQEVPGDYEWIKQILHEGPSAIRDELLSSGETSWEDLYEIIGYDRAFNEAGSKMTSHVWQLDV
ncbi:MAG: hypothetical protein ACOY3K_05465, partial [Candidatus Omnitrophota bacterium]